MQAPTPLDALRVALAAGLLSSCRGDLCTDGVPAEFVREVGAIPVEAGEECPPFSEDLRVGGFCGGGYRWETTCRFVRRDEGFVRTEWGFDESGEHTEDTGETTLYDLCRYEAVYEPGAGWACGRPLGGPSGPVVAGVVAEGAWSAGPVPALGALSEADRERIGEAWLAAAQQEHASVASFARFAIELLRFGAGPELARAAHDAALDEVRHAGLCFALAAAYLGRPVGPGPLPVAGLALAADRGDFAEAVVREGCVGESVAAIDAAARRSLATDPAVREVLGVIEADEARHAALAWRTLAWLVATDDGSLRARVAPLLAAPLRPPRRRAVARTETVGHGVLAPRDTAAVVGLARAAVAATWAGQAG